MNPSNDVEAADEGRHVPAEHRLWNESWYFDFFARDASVGGWVRLGLYPNLGVAWYHAYVVRPGDDTIAVADVEVPLPKGDNLEIRSHGLWADHVCETALDHWSLGNEVHALSVDDPGDLYHREPRGDIVPLGLDLEWETDGAPYHYLFTTRYEVPCRVHGEILVGDRRHQIDGYGQRDHSWGERDWWQFGWVWTSGRLDDGLRFHGSDIRIEGQDIGFGYVQHDDGSVVGTNTVYSREDLGDHQFPTTGEIRIGDLELGIEPIAFAPALLIDGERETRFPRALCRFTAADGRQGLGWTEWNQPSTPGQ